MTKRFVGRLAQIASVRQSLDLLAEDLAHKRSILVILPAGVEPAALWSDLQTELWRREFSVLELSLPALSGDRPPVIAMSESLRVTWPSGDTPRTVANLAELDDLPEVIILEGLHELQDDGRLAWLAFLKQWAQVCQTLADSGKEPTRLCVITQAEATITHVPESGLHLAIHWWWGFPSALDMRLLCRLNNASENSYCLARWREYLLPALAGCDLSLAEYLWDSLDSSTEELVQHLDAFAQSRGWTADNLEAWAAETSISSVGYEHGRRMPSPPSRWRALWAHGALHWTQEYGLELHPAALVALGRENDLKHRLWRGQAELLLPLIDHLRLTLCDELTRRHGPDWPVRWDLPQSAVEEAEVRADPLACQWGYLMRLLRNRQELRSSRRWISPGSRAHWIRNELAHYRPVTFRDFEGLWREIQRVSSQASSR